MKMKNISMNIKYFTFPMNIKDNSMNINVRHIFYEYTADLNFYEYNILTKCSMKISTNIQFLPKFL